MKKNTGIMGVGSVLLGAVLLFSLYGIGRSVIASGWGKHEEHERYEERREFSVQRSTMSPVQKNYVEECGSCHMAYPAGLLPPQSWNRIMNGLDDHFGENAELDPKTAAELTQYLERASAPRAGEYRKMFRNLGGAAPLRITELPYFRHEHNEIPSRFIKGNDKVGSLSQCNSCHRDAERGWFDEDNVVIPGVGRWDD